jgi:hypothetical protein
MTKQALHDLIDRLPDSQTGAAKRYLEFLLTHDEASVGPEMLNRIDRARLERGPGIPHEEILREFGS